jgi:hypothetical protein
MKTILIVGFLWVGISLILVGARLIVYWINHHLRHRVSGSDHQHVTPPDLVETENKANVIALNNTGGIKRVFTNLSISPKTGKITSPRGEVEPASYQRPKTAKTIKKTQSDNESELE